MREGLKQKGVLTLLPAVVGQQVPVKPSELHAEFAEHESSTGSVSGLASPSEQQSN
jgi:hypothetical protein